MCSLTTVQLSTPDGIPEYINRKLFLRFGVHHSKGTFAGSMNKSNTQTANYRTGRLVYRECQARCT